MRYSASRAISLLMVTALAAEASPGASSSYFSRPVFLASPAIQFSQSALELPRVVSGDGPIPCALHADLNREADAAKPPELTESIAKGRILIPLDFRKYTA